MSQKKCKLVLQTALCGFAIVKSVNTLQHGVPGDELSRDQVDRILIDNKSLIINGRLTVEFIK